MRVLVQLQRIGIGGIETPPEHANRLQAGNGANHDTTIDDSQVLPLQQHEAEVAGDIGVFVIGLVGRAGRQNRDAVVARMFHRLQSVAEGAEEGSEAVNRCFGIDVGEGSRGRHAVFKREARAGWRLRAISEHPPVAVGAAADFEGAEMQIVPGRRLYANQRPLKFRIGGDERGWENAFFDELVVAIDIGNHRFEEIGALHEARRKSLPFALVDQNRNV